MAKKRGTKLAAVGALALVLGTCISVWSSPAKTAPSTSACTWGASSAVATLDGGHVAASTPRTSGCTPDPG